MWNPFGQQFDGKLRLQGFAQVIDTIASRWVVRVRVAFCVMPAPRTGANLVCSVTAMLADTKVERGAGLADVVRRVGVVLAIAPDAL